MISSRSTLPRSFSSWERLLDFLKKESYERLQTSCTCYPATQFISPSLRKELIIDKNWRQLYKVFSAKGIGELFEKNFRGVFPTNLRESILPIISLWCQQKQAQHQWHVYGEVPDNLRDIGCDEALNFMERNSKKNYISYIVKISATRPARHLKLERRENKIKFKFKFVLDKD